MHRFFVEEKELGEAATVTLSHEESLHAARVLRLKAGEEIRLLDGKNLYSAELLQVNEKAVTARVMARLESPESSVQITLLQGLPKADKLEWIVQKSTELGCWDILPVEMARSVAKVERDEKYGKRQERLNRIALEAAKQSGRAHVPSVLTAQSFQAACRWLGGEGPAYDAVFVAWEEEQSLLLSEAVQRAQEKGKLKRIAVLIGPEGGISVDEWKKLEAVGAVSVTLGKRILRTETAGFCALAVIMATLGEM